MVELADLSERLIHSVLSVNRWLHLVATTLIVGGTLFYELVVPIAIADLKPEQQYTVFGRARWVFRWVVWISAVLLAVSGSVSVWQMWDSYTQPFPRGFPTAGGWAIAHVGAGAAAVVIALLLTIRRAPPAHPIGWMRVNLVILLAVIFLASAGRHVRLTMRRHADEQFPRSYDPIPTVRPFPQDDDEDDRNAATRAAATRPATAPAGGGQ